MKKFDPDNLSLSATLVFVIPIAILLSIWLWLSQKPYDFDGARGLAVDSTGVVHIQLDKDLYRMDKLGNSLPKIDLSELGVVDFVGDLTFNNQDELLLRPGTYDTGFLENLSILFRVSNKRTLEADAGDGLFLCDLNAMQCRPFGGGAHDFNRGFFSDYNHVDGTTVISDASRHELHKFDVDGHMLATFKDDLRFPNEVVFDDTGLFLVDTNHKMVKQMELADDEFGKVLNTHMVGNLDSNKSQFDYPFVMEKVGDHWWLIMLDNNMHKGGVYVYDTNWKHINTLDLGEADLPVGLLNLGNEVLLTDIESNGVHRYSLAGEKLGMLEHVELNAALAHNVEQRGLFKMLGVAYLALMAVLTIIVFVWAFFLQSRTSKAQLAENKDVAPARELKIGTIEGMVQWMPVSGLLGSLEKARKVQAVLFVVIILGFALAIFYINAYLKVDSAMVGLSEPLLWSALACCGLLFLTEEHRVRIGVYQEQLVLHDQVSDRAFLASGETILHDGQHIAFGEFSAQTHHASNKGNELAAFVRHVYPLLSNATVVNPNAMALWKRLNTRNQTRSARLKAYLILFVMAVFIVVNVIKIFG